MIGTVSRSAMGGVAVFGVAVWFAFSPPALADSREAVSLVRRGHVAANAGDNKLARKMFTDAIASDPDYLPAYDAAVPLWLEAGELGELAKYLEIATTRHRSYAFGWYTLGYVYRVRGRPELSVIAYETYLQLRPTDPDPRFGLALALIDQGADARAVLELQRYLRRERRPERGDYVARARELVIRLGGAVPNLPERSDAAELARARKLIDGHRYASALAVLDSIAATEAGPRGEMWLLRSSAHLGAGRPEAAIAAGFVALGLRGGDRHALELLADAFDSLGSRGAVGSYLRSLAERE